MTVLATACGAEPAAPKPTTTPTPSVIDTDEAADAPAVGTLKDLIVEDLAQRNISAALVVAGQNFESTWSPI